MAAFNVPKLMRAAQCTAYGDYGTTPTFNFDFDPILSVQNDVHTPQLGVDTPPSGFKNPMLVKVLSVALSPGDVRAMSGMTSNFQGPPSFPYVPGGDVCGIVVEVPKEEEEKRMKPEEKCKFKVGDRIAARFMNKPMGMLGEYALVNHRVCDLVPESVSNDDAAALASSGAVAWIIAEKINKGESVLIFGAGGGVGSHLCQLARLNGASRVVGVGKDAQRLKEKPLGCDDAVDYTAADPFNVDEWKEKPFDVIVDLAGGSWPALVRQIKMKNKLIVKPANEGGRFLTITPDKTIWEAQSVWAILKIFLFPALWRAFYTRYGLFSCRSLPTYTSVMGLPSKRDVVTKTLGLAAEKKLSAVIDKRGPFPFTSEGVRDAFRLQASQHANGKVVIKVANS